MSADVKGTAPLVSVIMPAYNAEPFIAEAISSVLAQSVTDLELLVIDDCSMDGTYGIAMQQADPRICVLRNEKNAGVARTRNRGIEMARGKYIAFLDSDDIWHPQKLQRQLERLEAAGADLCYCSYAIIGRNGEKAKGDYIVSDTATFCDILKENYIQCSAMLIRAEVVKKYMFNTEFFHEDYILGLNILKDGHKAVGCPELLLSWRYLDNSRSFNKKKAAMNRWRIYRKYLQLPLHKSVYFFTGYALAGFRKYFRKA